MKDITKTEADFIRNNFYTPDIFISYCTDYLKYAEDRKTSDSFEIDSTPFSTENLTTGIMLSVELLENELVVNMLVDGSYRELKTDVRCSYNLLMARERIAKYDVWDEKAVKDFKFVQHKPYVVKIVDNIITVLKPLDFTLYEEALKLLMELLQREREGLL